VQSVASILARFPHRELDIRRRCAADRAFRAICADYDEAARALRRWREKGAEGVRQAGDYEALLEELESEILGHLGAPLRNG